MADQFLYVVEGGTAFEAAVREAAAAAINEHARKTTDAHGGIIANAGGVASFKKGLLSERPVSGGPGEFYFSTDVQRLSEGNGSGWSTRAVSRFEDLVNRPASFPPTAHKASHQIGGADALTPADVGAIAAAEKGVAGGVATLRSDTAKVPLSQIDDSLIGGVNYRGTWDASTNVPALASAAGTKGHYYRVSAAGATNLDGITDWKDGEWAI